MTRKYYFKATFDGRKAAWDGYPYDMGENVHPNPDLSKVVCGAGFHLAKDIYQALIYVPRATEVYLAVAGRILGEDDTKVRTDVATLLWRIPQVIIDDHLSKRKLLEDDYSAKCKLFYHDYIAKCEVLDIAKCEVLDDSDYRAKRKLPDEDYYAKRQPIDEDHDAKYKKLNRATMRRIIKAASLQKGV